MVTDFSRIRFNPLHDHSSVLLKQGAVLLDADANEGEELINRRFRALASDLGGPAIVSKMTPNAFKITAGGTVAEPTLSIGAGRVYVDGLLAENHGSPTSGAVFDPVLGEPKFAGAVSYTEQPYLPAAPGLLPTGIHIVYLDVWQREVTHVEQPDLVEIAVGVETSSRLQTVWQVRLHEVTGFDTVTCATEPREWLDLIAPSTGVLSTGHVPVPALEDPCELPPTGGYRGLENQLYRVEIHDAGQPGQGATFKWSRENSSVACGVEEVLSARRLRLQSLGRDDVLGFAAGDWIEVTNDEREFSLDPGELRKIVEVNEDTRIIVLNEDLPTAIAPVGTGTKSTRPRVKRWEQKGTAQQVGPSSTLVPFHDVDNPTATFPVIPGVIPVPVAGTELVLEHGLTVSFDSTGDKGLLAGDFWVFAARTATAEAEQLDRAPPRGTHHHFARLAVWNAEAREVTDCRVAPTPSGQPAEPAHDCACTVCVTPNGELSIEAAIEKVKHTGGTVCLAPGFYKLGTSPVNITGARSVRIRGQSPPSKLQTPPQVGSVVSGEGGVFSISFSDAIVIEDLLLTVPRSATGTVSRAAVSVANSSNVVLQGLSIEANREAIEISGEVPNLRIARNEIQAGEGIVGQTVSHEGEPPEPRHRNSLIIEDNWIQCDIAGVSLVIAAKGDTIVTRNKIQGSKTEGISLKNLSEGPSSSTTISENHIEAIEGGITCVARRASIRENRLLVEATRAASAAIVFTSEREPGECHLIDNFIHVGKGRAMHCTAKSGSVVIGGNRVEIKSTTTEGLVVEAKECLFHDNVVEAQTVQNVSTVELNADVAIVNANRVIVNPPERTAIEVKNSPRSPQVTILGNITNGKILAQGALPLALREFNVMT